MTRFSTLLFLAALPAAACVPKAPKRANSAEARAGAPRPDAEQASAEGLLGPAVTTARKPELKPGQLYNAGYWHWDGVRYVRVGGTVEDAFPPYVWR